MSRATTSHMMKTTKRGRPFLKDTLDLFATLIVSLEPTTHKQFFRTFPNSFTTEEATQNLSSLKFSQSNRAPDPKDPSRVITTTTTTTFSMSRDMAKAMCQHFMDARLIENAADRTSNLFKERGVYVLTPKGLHVLERFISKNGIAADHLLKIFATQPICLKLLHLERRASDDEIIISPSVINALFKRFAGRAPNYMNPAMLHNTDPAQQYNDRSKGMPLCDIVDRVTGFGGKSSIQTFKNCFAAVAALEWICDFTSIVGRDEAAEMMAHFVRFNYITLVSDKRKGGEAAVIFTVRGNASGGASENGDFRCTAKALYRITDEGRALARWDQARPSQAGARSPNDSSVNLAAGRTSTDASHEGNSANELAYGPGTGAAGNAANLSQTTDAKIHRRISMAEKLRGEYKAGEGAPTGPTKESNTDRLRHILDEPALRSLFREFLRGNFCEENLSFWLDVQDFKRRFNTTSSAVADSGKKGGPSPGTMEKHHESLITMAFVIYNTYLAPSSPCELNIDHGLRNELVAYLNEVLTHSTGKTFQGRVEPEQAHSFNATQLHTMIRLYERIQTHVFRLMATDSVPKFIKTSRFVALRNWVEEFEAGEDQSGNAAANPNPTSPPGLNDGEGGRTYMSVSSAAHDKKGDAPAATDKNSPYQNPLVPTKSIS